MKNKIKIPEKVLEDLRPNIAKKKLQEALERIKKQKDNKPNNSPKKKK